MSAMQDYRAALQRLIAGKPLNIVKGSAINNDLVALEAGRKRGSIKKSRPEHSQLIEDISAAAANRDSAKPTIHSNAMKQKALKNAAQERLMILREEYELALTKIVSLEHENHSLRKKVSELNDRISECDNVTFMSLKKP